MDFFRRTPAQAGTAGTGIAPDQGYAQQQGVFSAADGVSGQSANPGPGLQTQGVQGSGRDVRAQAVHRLQVGLFGLAGMLLLIGLANIIMDRAQLSEKAAEGTQAAIAAASSSPSEASAKDPLVDMGVAPELPMAGAPAATATDTGGN